MFRMAVCSSYFGDTELEAAVGLFGAHQCREVELAEKHGAELLDRGNPAHVGAALRQHADGCGVVFSQGHLAITGDIAHPDRSTRNQSVDDLKRWLDLFAGLGISLAVLHPGGVTAAAAGYPETRIAAARGESLRLLAAYARGNGIAIVLENIGQEATQLLNMLREVGADNLAAALNLRTLAAAGGSPAEFIREANGLLRAVHAADCTAEADGVFPDDHGTMGWPEIIRTLRQIEYRDLFCWEVPGENKLPLELRLEHLDRVRVWFARATAPETVNQLI